MVWFEHVISDIFRQNLKEISGNQCLAACDRSAKVDLCMLNLSTCYMVHSWEWPRPLDDASTPKISSQIDVQGLQHFVWADDWLFFDTKHNLFQPVLMRWSPGELRPALANWVATLPSGLGAWHNAWDVSSWIVYTWRCPTVSYIE